MKWVRPIISIIAVCGITAGFFTGRIGSEAYVGLMSVAVTWWYASRDQEKKDEKKVT